MAIRSTKALIVTRTIGIRTFLDVGFDKASCMNVIRKAKAFIVARIMKIQKSSTIRILLSNPQFQLHFSLTQPFLELFNHKFVDGIRIKPHQSQTRSEENKSKEAQRCESSQWSTSVLPYPPAIKIFIKNL